jgi:hypothetical protein
MESRLREIETVIEETGAAVSRGGPFDRWDLEVRTGPLASARLLGATEEHGAGRQQVRYRVWPRLPWPGPALSFAFGVLAILAAADQALMSATVLAVVSGIILVRMLFDLANATATLLAGVES